MFHTELAPTVGHNNPPGPLEDARDVIGYLSRFMEEVPVIETEDQARQAKLHIDRTRAACGSIEDERDRKVRPLNEAVATINAEYKAVHNEDGKRPGSLDKLLNELKARVTVYTLAEEAKREAIAEAARQAAMEAERAAREAEERERDAIQNAQVGETTDVGAAIVEADQAFADFERRTREAQRAERETNVRIGGGFSGRSLSMRTTETLVLESYSKALKAIGPNEKIETAILSAARDYRKLKGSLPAGVTAVTERKI